MPVILPVKGISPTIPNSCFVAPNATIVGDVEIGEECSIWFNAVLRGDVNSIRMGDKVNIQDGAVVHCTYQKTKAIMGNNISVGHNALVHGCTIEDNVLIGMGAIVMDHAVVETNALVAAGAVVLENTIVESGWIYAGVPAKKVKQLNQEEIERLIRDTAKRYVKYMDWYRN